MATKDEQRLRQRIAKFSARRDELQRTARAHQRLFVPTPGDIGHALVRCFATLTGSKDDPLQLTDAGDGFMTSRERVDLNEYEHTATMLLPGDVLISYSSRDDIVGPPVCEVQLVASTSEDAAKARQWLLDAGAPLLPLVITLMDRPKAPDLSERWTAHGWSIDVSSIRPRADREPIHQIYVPHHDVGPWQGRETENESDHPDAVKLIADLCLQLIGESRGSSLGDFRFPSRQEFDRVCAALQAHMLKEPDRDAQPSR